MLAEAISDWYWVPAVGGLTAVILAGLIIAREDLTWLFLLIAVAIVTAMIVFRS